MSFWLTFDELKELTGFSQRRKQLAALAELGVRFRQRPADGFPLVEKNQFTESTAKAKVKRPNFAAVEG